MSRIEEIQSRVTGQSRSVLTYAADLMEWSLQRNLKLAQDVADFTVARFRVPAEATCLSTYGEGVAQAYSDLGQALQSHGEAYFSRLREIPSEVAGVFQETVTDVRTPEATETAESA